MKTNPRNHKHGMCYSSEYGTWAAMKSRCINPKDINYRHYGGRGIKVCERWQQFTNFYADMGPRPTAKHSLDRIDNNGGYEPLNCRWATQLEQMTNVRWNNSHPGVYLEIRKGGRSNRWRAYLRRKHLGSFGTKEEAIEARRRALA